MGASPGPPIVLSTAEEIVIAGLLVYAGSDYLGMTTRELKEVVGKLRSDGRDVPWHLTSTRDLAASASMRLSSDTRG